MSPIRRFRTILLFVVPTLLASCAPGAPAPVSDGAPRDESFAFDACEPDGQFSGKVTLTVEEARALRDAGDEPDYITPRDVIYAGLDPYLEDESMRYRTVYLFRDGDGYAADELALEITGLHAGVPEEYDYYHPLATGDYLENRLVVEDLHSGRRKTLIDTGEGIWLGDGEDWVAISPDLEATVANTFHALSATGVANLIGGGGLAAGVRSPWPVMALDEKIAGEAAIHYCWIPEATDGPDGEWPAFGYLVHAESLYSFFQDVELHAWVSAEDDRLLRLAMTGAHVGDRYYNNFVDHDGSQTLFMWTEFLSSDQAPEISSPGKSEIKTTLEVGRPADGSLKLPLPPGAEPVAFSNPEVALAVEVGDEIPLSDLEEEDINPLPTVNREILYEEQDALWRALTSFDLELDSDFSVHKSELSVAETLAFFMRQMPDRGWALDEVTIIAWRSTYVLRFSGEDGLVMIVREGAPDGSLVYAIRQ